MLERIVRTALDGMIPLLVVVVALVAGAVALLLTPREEEPQIVVPSADVLVQAPGLSAREVERLVATPLEKLLAQIDGVEHVYSVSQPGSAAISVAFFVGEDREDSLLKLYSKVYSHQDQVPSAVTGWVVKPVEVDDVPILTATLWSVDPELGGFELRRLAEEVALALQSVPETNRIDVIGGRPRELTVLLSPLALAGRLTAMDDVLRAIGRSNVRTLAGEVDAGDARIRLELDGRVDGVAALRRLVVNVVDGVPVRLADVAEIADGPAEPDSYTWIRFADAEIAYPAVNVAVAKRRGANAVSVANALTERLDGLRDELFPAGVEFTVTRDYGATADEKIGSLLASLTVAVLIVVALIGLTLGWRAALVVALAVPVCYGVTLALDYAAGYTINRVTLFALILALGLLVDDPITGVDNMDRHLGDPGSAADSVVRAMVEIRMPLIMSTIAVVIVFTPMSFITGMMGPYMSPMAFNVPVAVITSTLVAFLVTPWLGLKLLPGAARRANAGSADPGAGAPGRVDLEERGADAVTAEHAGRGWYARLLVPLLDDRRRAVAFLGVLGLAFVVCALLPLLRVVPLKLLPYDNKNEFQLVLDLPEGSTLEDTDAVAVALSERLVRVPEVRGVNAYVGTHAPMDFNGMIRRYYLRQRAHEGELHVMLVDKLARDDQSHALALLLRGLIAEVAAESGAEIKLVEVPPGPPVLASIVAEHYGAALTPYEDLIRAARATAERLRREPGVVDVDVSAEAAAERWRFVPDQEKAALSGIDSGTLGATLSVLASGAVAGYVAQPDEAVPLPIRLRVPYSQRTELARLFVKGAPGISKIRERGSVADAPTPLVSLAELVSREVVPNEQPIFHKDLRPVAYTYAELAGRVPAAVVFDVSADLAAPAEGLEGVDGGLARPLAGRTYLDPGGGIPWALPQGVEVSFSGEGEWDITLRVFRDLGIAFGVALIGLFLVIRVQTGRAALTLIIMLSIPLTVIGIMPGFWLLNAVTVQRPGGYADPVLFTATAMIGMIALAGIVVRNSLILVEFVEQARTAGASVRTALLEAGRLRTRPVLLTAGTTLLGNVVITLDPIFAGLAWSIIFGVAASTLFTLLVVPVVYALVYGETDEVA